MVKFDLNVLSYLEKEDFKVLSAVETGMRNHEIVPAKLVGAIAELRNGTGKILRNLCYNRLISYERGKKFDGYRLTNLGYDYLALRVLRNRDVLDQVGNQIGVGKEASVYIARDSKTDTKFALKVHRLGRTSFKTVFNKRDYHKNKVCNWLYLSRLAALREYSFMCLLFNRGFNVPQPIDNNRHCIVMKWINGTLLNNICIEDKIDFKQLLEKLLNMIIDLANKYGVVHGDFNEFNILIDNQTDKPYLIDFPQMIATNHELAKEYFERDVNCIVTFFEKRFNCIAEEIPTFELKEPTEEKIVQKLDDEILSRFLEDNINYNKDSIEKYNDESCENKFFNEMSSENLILNKETDSEVLNKNDLKNEEMKNNVNVYNLNSIKEEINEIKMNNDNTDKISVYSYAPSKFGASTILSNYTSEDIRSRLRKEKDRKEKRDLLKQSFRKIKGEASTIGRQRKNNKINIKEDETIFDWF